MMKMNLKTMVVAAAMAAFMVYAPAMAEEDIILEEPVELSGETALETEAALPVDVMQIEAIVEAEEVPAEVAQAAEDVASEENAVVTEAEVEAVPEETGLQSFFFENDEVIIRAAATVELPENVVMQVQKLVEGSAEFEAAKTAAQNSCGASDNAEYKFYNVIFTVDGAEIDVDDSVIMQVEFKTVKMDSEAQSQSVLHIDETEVRNVTAQTEQGSNMSSVNFAV